MIYINPKSMDQMITIDGEIFDLRKNRFKLNNEYYLLCNTNLKLLLCRIGSLKRIQLHKRFFIESNQIEKKNYLKLVTTKGDIIIAKETIEAIFDSQE